MKIAIIGTGISGMSAAYFLNKEYNVTIYEANDYLGGHTHTHLIEHNENQYSIDTGFIVFNKKTYPLFHKLLNETGTHFSPTSMSFAVSCEKTGLEYNGTNLNKLFAQRSNIFKASFLSFVWGITNFNKKAKAFLAENNNLINLSEFFKKYRIKNNVIEYYIAPMMSAVWSTDPTLVHNFPASFILKFFENHGFLEIDDRPQWYVIKGGSKNYIPNLFKNFNGNIKLNEPIYKITRNNNKVQIISNKDEAEFDAVIMATHSNTTLRLLEDPSIEEKNILSKITYLNNPTYLHLDESFLPKRKLAWASWNYLIPKNNKSGSTVTYNMNILQNIDAKVQFNVTLNPHRSIDQKLILKELNYSHPLFNLEAINAQNNWEKISGKNNTFFCGAYWRNGFHEDGVFSAKRVVDQIKGKSIES